MKKVRLAVSSPTGLLALEAELIQENRVRELYVQMAKVHVVVLLPKDLRVWVVQSGKEKILFLLLREDLNAVTDWG